MQVWVSAAFTSTVFVTMYFVTGLWNVKLRCPFVVLGSCKPWQYMLLQCRPAGIDWCQFIIFHSLCVINLSYRIELFLFQMWMLIQQVKETGKISRRMMMVHTMVSHHDHDRVGRGGDGGGVIDRVWLCAVSVPAKHWSAGRRPTSVHTQRPRRAVETIQQSVWSSADRRHCCVTLTSWTCTYQITLTSTAGQIAHSH